MSQPLTSQETDSLASVSQMVQYLDETLFFITPLMSLFFMVFLFRLAFLSYKSYSYEKPQSPFKVPYYPISPRLPKIYKTLIFCTRCGTLTHHLYSDTDAFLCQHCIEKEG